MEYVNLKTKVSDIVKNYPITVPLLIDMGMICYTCSIATEETLDMALKAHQLNPKEIVDELNEWIEEKTKELKDQGLSDEDIKNLEFVPDEFDDFD